MAGSSAKPTASNASRGRKRVEVLKRARDGSAFTRCEACNKNVPVVLIDLHSCSLDSKIRMSLEAQVVEKTVEITKAEKRSASSAGKGKAKKSKAAPAAKKGKRPPTAFFLFMSDFREEYKAAHPDNKSVATVSKEGGQKWKSMTDEEKKPYIDKAAELKAEYENGEGSAENKVDAKTEQEVDQPAKHNPLDDTDDEEDGNAEDDAQDEEEDGKNDLDDDI